MYPHRIRLRGPWDFKPLARIVSEEPLPPAGRMTMPARWGEGGLRGFAGRVRFQRRFGYPGQIDAEERVWLTFAGVEGVADMRLNGHDLGQRDGALGPFEFEVTSLLQVRNELQVEVEAAGDSGGLWGDVALEVRRTAYLRPVRVWATRSGETADLHVAGEVVGTCDGPLDLYVLLDNATVSYTTVVAEPAGRPFHLTAEGLDRERWQPRGAGAAGLHEVRVELVHGATVWYRIEQPFGFPEEGMTPIPPGAP
jgi:beta-galactosidase/beta-glucuronidase